MTLPLVIPQEPVVLRDISANRTPSPLTLSFVEERGDIADEWRALERELGGSSLACSWTWTATWLDHFGDLIPHRFVVARSGGIPRGICLLAQGVEQKEGPFQVRTLHLGTAGEPQRDSVCVEYNDLLVAPQFRNEFVRKLLEQVAQDPRWDRFNLDGMTADAAQPFLSAQPAFRARETPSWYFDLNQARENGKGVLGTLSYKVRKKLRHDLRAWGELTVEWAETSTQAESIFADLVRLHQERWTAEGKPGSFASQRFSDFHRDLIERLFPCGQAILFRVRQGAQVVGCLYAFVEGNRLLAYQSGRCAENSHLSPGAITNYLFIEEAFRRGFGAFDFLGGDSRHKRDLSTHCNQIVWSAWRRPRLKLLIVEGLKSVRRTLFRDPRRSKTGQPPLAPDTAQVNEAPPIPARRASE